jgi:hypothetical protein
VRWHFKHRRGWRTEAIARGKDTSKRIFITSMLSVVDYAASVE